jgi:hypothetical protein
VPSGKTYLALVWLAAFAAAAAGCDGSRGAADSGMPTMSMDAGTGGQGGSPGTGGGGGGGGMGAGGAACNMVANTAPPIDYVKVTGSPPTMPEGGPIAGGRYHLTSFTIYGALAGCVALSGVALTEVFAATSSSSGTLSWATTGILARLLTGAPDGGVDDARGIYNYQTTGTLFELRASCLSPGVTGADVETSGYTATATELRLYQTSTVCGTSIQVLTKQ